MSEYTRALMMSRRWLLAMRRLHPVSRRTIETTTVINPGDFQMDEVTRDRVAPKIGNRDVVGYGYNGMPNYVDIHEFPCPAIRWGANTPEFLKLREREKEDWNTLSIEEKKALYRGNFCKTYAEMSAPKGLLKSSTTVIIWSLAVASCIFIFIKTCFYTRYPLPHTITPEWQEAMLYRMVDQRQGRIHGVGSKYDYENKRWKD